MQKRMLIGPLSFATEYDQKLPLHVMLMDWARYYGLGGGGGGYISEWWRD